MLLSRRILFAVFAIAATVTVFLGVRLIVSTVYWSQHRDAPIEAWMTIGMVARSYDVPPGVVAKAAGLPENVRDRRPLSEIASERGELADKLVDTIEEAIERHRAGLDRQHGEGEP
ncbi:hypothetical protein [Chthonobacter albigriseus]|uniref:hypothetical protein n=1 Tax=Chthonobacter albigriseus TaxID=1683161 RepID=UPI0015EE8F67|nr:hypothetical protein [Chthonobacter albigriseus]